MEWSNLMFEKVTKKTKNAPMETTETTQNDPRGLARGNCKTLSQSGRVLVKIWRKQGKLSQKDCDIVLLYLDASRSVYRISLSF